MPAKTERPHVALLLETSHASGRDMLRGISRYLREHDSWALFHEPRGLEESFPRWLEGWNGHGIIARIQNQAQAQQLHQIGIPIVDVLGLVPELALPLVHVDDGAIARMAAAHLIERGFRHFGYVGIASLHWSIGRWDEFRRCVEKLGGSADLYELPRHGQTETSWEMMENDLAGWVANLPKPAGVMVCSDQIGPKFLEACRRAGVAVPDEVAVIGVDDDEPLCEVCNPPLSSVRPAHDDVGYAAAALLEKLMRGRKRPAKPIWIAPRGITTRISTEVLAIEDRQVAKAMSLIREQACNGIQVDDLSRQVGLSRSVLQRRFRALLKRTVHEELLNVRLRRACDLITETNLPLIEIAEKTGFKHQEYMGAVFQRHLKITPANYRQQGRSGGK